MASDPLADSRAKLARAREQLDALHVAIREGTKTDSYSIETKYEPKEVAFIGRLELQRAPRGLSGDVRGGWAVDVHQIGNAMRSALDNLVCRVSDHEREGGVTPDDPKVKMQFPIYTSMSGYYPTKKSPNGSPTGTNTRRTTPPYS